MVLRFISTLVLIKRNAELEDIPNSNNDQDRNKF